MKKKVALLAAAACLSMLISPFQAYADESSKAESKSSSAPKSDSSKSDRSSKAETKKESDKSTVGIMAVMPQEWLDDDNYEFEVTFSNASERKSVYLDVDNSFTSEIELKKYQMYEVTFSDDIAGYDVGGIDPDGFMAERDNEMKVLTFRRHQDISAAAGDGVITAEQADELEAARNVVQQFISNTKKIGLDENNNDQKLLFNLNKDMIKDRFFEGTGKYYTPEVYKELTKTDAFYCYWLSYNAYKVIDTSDPYVEESIDEELSFFKDYDSHEQVYEGLRTAVGKEVRSVWEWLKTQADETGAMPDLFIVYMDMKNNVEYQIENAGVTKTEEVSADEDVVHIEDKVELFIDETEVPESERIDFTDDLPKEETIAKRTSSRFLRLIKDNSVTLIFLAVTGAAVLLTRRISKKVKEDSDEDD
ncbi:hypothetical protein [Ruminococcus sp.]|uniref:hypothetical protein n=1 Tax=Ruminococcus sp. TaxID=41978 RepID=UPI0025FD1D6A|nr:hypothetical protein [Ruminococcus sp.]MBQ8967279.1 hypothetical protein [Ruminococcus sp.]